MIAIIDYDAGNLKSVEKAFDYLGAKSIITRDPSKILGADQVVLPGVGAFGDAMGKLHQYELADVIREVAVRGTPLLGICLGLQLFFESSEESPGVEGLGLCKGKILRIPAREGLKIPHMGWNALTYSGDGSCAGTDMAYRVSGTCADGAEVYPASGICTGRIKATPGKGECVRTAAGDTRRICHGRLFEGIPEGSYVYFVHSYYLRAEDREIVKAQTFYSTEIDASVEQGNVFACQFHPEKSSEVGLAILRNFIGIGKGDC